jgi:hypothetical protein
MSPEAGLSHCRPHSGEWHGSRSRAGGCIPVRSVSGAAE